MDSCKNTYKICLAYQALGQKNGAKLAASVLIQPWLRRSLNEVS